MNPVTLKELRQLTRSRVISASLVAFFGLELLVVSLVLVACSNPDGTLDRNTGEISFYWLAAFLAPVLAFVIPGNVFSRLVSEHGPGRTELLATTALRPAAFVDGKIRSGLVLLAQFLFAALPFLLLSYLLGGVDVLLVLSWTAAVAFCASLALHLSLFLAALRLPAPARGALWALCVIPCVPFALFSAVGYENGCSWNDWTFLVTASGLVLTANLLLRGLAIALLSPPSTDRVRPLRLTVLALLPAWLAFFVVAAAVWGTSDFAGDVAECLVGFAGLIGLPLLALLAFDLSTPSGPSRRVLSERPRSRLRRLLRYPLSTGYESGLVFFLPFFAAAALAAGVALRRFLLAAHPSYEEALRTTLALLACEAYVLAALLYARAALRIPALGRRLSPRFTALFAAAFVGLCMLLPNLLALNGSANPDLCPFNLAGVDFNDLAVRGRFGRGHLGTNLRFHLRAAALALAPALLLHLLRVLRSLRTYLKSPPPETPRIR